MAASVYSSFSYHICQLEYQSHRIMAAFDILNYGGSDEGTISVAGAVLLKRFYETCASVGYLMRIFPKLYPLVLQKGDEGKTKILDPIRPKGTAA